MRVLLLAVLMALSVKVGAFNTGTGVSDIVVTDVGFQPKAILFWWTGRTGTVDAAGRESHFAGYGAATGTTQRWALTSNDIDAAAAQDAATAKTATGCLLSVSAAGAIDGKADLASFDSGGFTLSVSDAFPRDQRVHYLALGGADLTNAKAGEFTGTAAAVPHDESSTDPGFQPDVVFFANRHDSATTGEVALATGGVLGFGVAKSSSAQGVISLAADEASATMDTDGYGYTGECNAGPSTNAGGSVPARAAFVSMDANGFTVNRLEGTALWARFYLALKGCQVFVGNDVTSVTGSATIVTSGFGFAPKAVLVFSACRPTSTQDAATAPWNTSMGAATSTTERGAQGSISRDGIADAVVGTAIEHDEVYVSLTDATPPAIDGLMDISSFDSDGITFVMDDGDGAARRFFYVALGDAPASGITGTLSKALPLALVADGDVAVQGSLGKVVPLALDGAGAVAVQGTLSKPLPINRTLSGTVLVMGTTSRTVPLSLAASGTVTDPGINAALAKALPLALTAAADVAVAGSLTKALPLTVTADVDVLVRGTLTKAMPLSLATQGAVRIAGALTEPIPLTLVGQGGVQVSGITSRAVPLSLSAAGSVGTAGPITGSLVKVLPLTLVAIVEVGIPAGRPPYGAVVTSGAGATVSGAHGATVTSGGDARLT